MKKSLVVSLMLKNIVYTFCKVQSIITDKMVKKEGIIRMTQAIVFDMDGVIFDSEKIVRQGWQFAAQQMKLGSVDDLFLQCVGTNHTLTEKKMGQAFGEKFSYKEFQMYTKQFFQAYIEKYGLPVKKGVRELLEYLKEEDYSVGLASSSRWEYILDSLKQADLLRFFSVVVSGEHLRKSKPDPEIYLLACNKLQVFPKDSYAIEDSYNGVRAAYCAEMRPIMVPDLLPKTEEMRRMCEIILPNLFEVKSYLIQKDTIRKIQNS